MDGDLIIMGGHMQQTHRHSIVALDESEYESTSGRQHRINWTCRAFCEKVMAGCNDGGSSSSSSSGSGSGDG